MQIYCPFDTEELIRNVGRNKISNFALRYQYFLEGEVDKGKVKFTQDTLQLGDSGSLIKPLRERQTNQLNYLAKTYAVGCSFYTVDWRLIVGLGGEHVQETNMTFDYIYGVPYLPGSALKGIVRSWAIQEDFDNNEKLATQDVKFLDVFGSQNAAGKVLFLPAYPTDNVTLEMDIMNPHFPNYYTGTQAPTDTQDPVPINFLTLGQTDFRFIFLSKEQRLIDAAQNWVDEALQKSGLGAKTSVGYGHFYKTRQSDISRNFRYDRNFQVPMRKRPQRVSKISLDIAYQEFAEGPDSLDPRSIDIAPLKDCAVQFVQIATADDYIELDELEGIHPTLIETEEGLAERSEFGTWIWNNLKADLLSARILELPRLVYTWKFRRQLVRLPADELVARQEELIKITQDLQGSDGDLESVDIPEYFRCDLDRSDGRIRFLEYVRE